MLKVGDVYYWYGAKYEGAVTYAQDSSAGPARGSTFNAVFNAVTVYSSSDLVSWKFEGDALKARAAGKHPERGR